MEQEKLIYLASISIPKTEYAKNICILELLRLTELSSISPTTKVEMNKTISFLLVFNIQLYTNSNSILKNFEKLEVVL